MHCTLRISSLALFFFALCPSDGKLKKDESGKIGAVPLRNISEPKSTKNMTDSSIKLLTKDYTNPLVLPLSELSSNTLPVHHRVPRELNHKKPPRRSRYRHSTRVYTDKPVAFLLPPINNGFIHDKKLIPDDIKSTSSPKGSFIINVPSHSFQSSTDPTADSKIFMGKLPFNVTPPALVLIPPQIESSLDGSFDEQKYDKSTSEQFYTGATEYTYNDKTTGQESKEQQLNYSNPNRGGHELPVSYNSESNIKGGNDFKNMNNVNLNQRQTEQEVFKDLYNQSNWTENKSQFFGASVQQGNETFMTLYNRDENQLSHPANDFKHPPRDNYHSFDSTSEGQTIYSPTEASKFDYTTVSESSASFNYFTSGINSTELGTEPYTVNEDPSHFYYETSTNYNTYGENYTLDESIMSTTELIELSESEYNYYNQANYTAHHNYDVTSSLLSPEVASLGMKLVTSKKAVEMVHQKWLGDPVSYKRPSQRPSRRQKAGKAFDLSERVVNTRKSPASQDSASLLIPGVAGVDYPTLSRPPVSARKPCNSGVGYVPDRSSGCQVFYICIGNGVGEPLLCPNGTLFSKDFLVCDWWYNVECN